MEFFRKSVVNADNKVTVKYHHCLNYKSRHNMPQHHKNYIFVLIIHETVKCDKVFHL